MRNVALLFCTVVSFGVVGCGGTTGALQTPSKYSEAIIVNGSSRSSVTYNSVTYNGNYREHEKFALNSGLSRVGEGGHKKFIHDGDAYTIMLNSIFLPKNALDGLERVNGSEIVVLIDMDIEGSGIQQNIAVAAQFGLKDSQVLNFRDLTFTSRPKHNSKFPPYIRIKILEIDGENSEEIVAGLESLGKVTDSLGKFLPSPYIPAIQTGLEMGKIIAKLKSVKTIMDVEFQLYAPEANYDGAHHLFKTGIWLIAGIPNNSSQKHRYFQKLSWDGRRRRAYFDVVTDRQYLNVPTVALEVLPYTRNPSSVIQLRTEQITKAMEGGANLAEIEKLAGRLLSGTQVARAAEVFKNPTFTSIKSLASLNLESMDPIDLIELEDVLRSNLGSNSIILKKLDKEGIEALLVNIGGDDGHTFVESLLLNIKTAKAAKG